MINLTADEKKTVLAVFGDLLSKPYRELNTFIGSETIEKMSRLHNKLYYEDYCDRHGIRYDDMTDADFEQAYLEEWT